MSTTFNWIFLGHSSTALDPTEEFSGNMENAGAFVNQTYGSAGSPLFGKVISATMSDGYGAGGVMDVNNSSGYDTFTTDLGGGTATYSFDGTAIYNATVTYADGSSATVTAVLAQDTDGNLYLAPEKVANADTTAYEAKAIQSLTLDSVDTATNLAGMTATRYMTSFVTRDGYVDGTSGNDLINAKYVEPAANGTDRVDANDAMLAGRSGNDDDIRAGAGDDTVFSGLGNDQIHAGTGNDLVDAGAGDDTLYGEAGNDTLYFGAGNDVVYGGDGNDVIDDVAGGAHTGANLIDAGAGNDVVSTGDGADTLFGGSGDDTMSGEGGADSLDGGAGGDALYGGDGNDRIDGGDGNDLVFGGAGDDTLTGGAGHDRFQTLAGDGADRITDFEMTVQDGRTTDQLDVSGLTNADGSPVKSFDIAVSDDGRGNAVLGFPGGESIVLVGVSPAQVYQPGMLHQMGVACFAQGTRIATPEGLRAVESLAPGDMVRTAQGVAPVLWHGVRRVDAQTLADHPQLRPVRIGAGHYGLTEDLVVSPQHGVRVGDVLIRARHLARWGQGARVAKGIRSVTYHHILLPRHGLLLAAGGWSESFHPGPEAMRMLGWQDRIAVARLIQPGARIEGDTLAQAYGPRCLPLVSGREARLALGPGRRNPWQIRALVGA